MAVNLRADKELSHMASRKAALDVNSATRFTRFPPQGTSDPSDDPRSEVVAAPDLSHPKPATRINNPAKAARLHPAVGLLLVSLVLPVYFNLGPLRLSPNRALLLLLFFPAMAGWVSGAAGRIRVADFWVVGLCLWGTIAMFISAGMSTIQFSGITTVETFGAYLIGRVYIRTEAQYRAVIRILGMIVLLLVPGAIIESFTGIRIYNRLFDSVLPTFPWADYEKRLHMFRSQTGFEHPILFGVFTAFCFAPIYANARVTTGRLKACMRSSQVIVATFFSLSMGAYLGIIIQLMLMTWGFVLRNVRLRWKILGILTTISYVVVDLLSNRTPFQVFSSYIAFDAHTAYWRVLIFKYGMENVWHNPFFGLGYYDTSWKRPDFMATSSIDNLWLVFAVRYGIPGFILILGVYLAVLIGLMRAKLINPILRGHRDALVFSFIGLGIAICTVHLWSSSFVFMMFMLGSGAWFSDDAADGNVSANANVVADGIARLELDRTSLTVKR